jgi:antitoxin (DNA-binding transcriptional repressor) of toxin-antitoxin stability system
MRTAKIAELRNGLSRFLDYVKAGGRVVILDRDRPVAEIIPVGAGEGAESDRSLILALERKGIVRKGTAVVSAASLTGPLPGKNAGVLEALLDERHKGR